MRGGKHIDTVDANTVSKTDLAEMMIVFQELHFQKEIHPLSNLAIVDPQV